MTDVKSKLVLLFKANKENEEDKFAKVLTASGYEVTSIPVLKFKFVNADKLKTSLENIANFSGIILTSPRTVESVVKVTAGSAEIKNTFATVRCYVVGKATGILAKKAGFSPTGEESGNAVNLAKLIAAGPEQAGKPFLYPCANIRRDVLIDNLKEKDFAIEELTVYETGPNEALESTVKDFLNKQGPPEFIVFFSPSGVQATDVLVKTGVLQLDKAKLIALGPATKMEMESRGFSLHGVPAKPEPASLVTLLKEEKTEDKTEVPQD